MTAPWTHADFAPGETLGEVAVTLDDARLDQWASIYGTRPAPGAPVPRGLLVAAMMEGYTKAIQPRPPGNVHAGQTLLFAGPVPAPGATLSLRLSCRDKEVRKGRNWVTFAAELSGPDGPVMTGEIRSIWAA